LLQSTFYFHLSKKNEVHFYFYSSNEAQYFEQVCTQERERERDDVERRG